MLAGEAATEASQCATDIFSVTNPGGSATPPAICGINTGEHSKNQGFSVLFLFFLVVSEHFIMI